MCKAWVDWDEAGVWFVTQNAEALSLKDFLQWREIDNEQLPHDGGEYSEAERPVTAQAHLMDHTGLRERERCKI